MGRDSSIPKVIGTTAVNMPVCIAKDRAFTLMFGIIAPSRLPMMSYGLFAIRDTATIAGSFSAPKDLSKYMQRKSQYFKSKPEKADILAQLVCPMAIQLGSTPLHLLGLDLYNNKNDTPAKR
eukprot:TRINITY_DN16404_c0_g1_i1.p1 TRINITY_DN16404_c0_g1~~TRINITY_DN16404_c0_g1_i1.p1  ORF type:complete len:122 (+),score=17.15 TRINITY_DN16404_c0_g1_i1:210-575(+)